MLLSALLSIGQLAARTGLSVSAIRFYEAMGFTATHEGMKLHLTRTPDS